MQSGANGRSSETGFLALAHSSFSILSSDEKRRILALVIVQSLLSLIDLLSIMLVGIFVTNSFSESSAPGFLLKMKTGIESIFGNMFDGSVLILALAISLLILKTIFSVIATKMTLRFFGNCAASLSSNLVSFVFSRGISPLGKRSLQDMIFSTTRGVEVLTLQILAPLCVMVSDLFLLIVLVCGLFLIDIPMAIVSIMIFGGLATTLNFLMGAKSSRLGRIHSSKTIETNLAIERIFKTFRELFVKNRISHETDKVKELRFELSKVLASVNFYPYIGKYVIEAGLVLGGSAIGLVLFATRDLSSALTVTAMFLATGSRIAPSVLRLQQSYISVRSCFGLTELSLELIKEYQQQKEIVFPTEGDESNTSSSVTTFCPDLSISNLRYRHPGNDNFEIQIESLEFKVGTTIAIVGPSGSGKSTFVDLLLGLLIPNEGEILISSLTPRDAISMWPGKIAYTPQHVSLFDGSLFENVAQGYSSREVDSTNVEAALQKAGLSELLMEYRGDLNTKLGTEGIRLSGGQEQRVGIARALLTLPKLMVLDEATSSLDAVTERNIVETLTTLRGDTTLIVVAHRLSTVVDADLVVYIDGGKVIATGSFEEIRQLVANFDLQVRTLGLV